MRCLAYMYLLSTSFTLPFYMLTASSRVFLLSSRYTPILSTDLSTVGMTSCDLCLFSLFLSYYFLIYYSPLAASHLFAFSECILVISCTLSCNYEFWPRMRSNVALASLSSRISLSLSCRSYSSMMLPAFSLSALAVLI
jgi:hypothetical protein